MKNKEPKKKWTGKKQIWYGAAGLFCLVAAVLILILGNGMGAQAESRGDYNIDHFQISGDTYLVTSVSQLLELGNATADQTNGKNFKLTNDLTISAITTAATGAFAGTFDGNGHVITITELKISDSTQDEAAQGVLFGTVKGAVQNLIVDIKDKNASYTRTSDAGVTISRNSPSKWTDSTGNAQTDEPKPYMKNIPVSELDSPDSEQGSTYEQIDKTPDGGKITWTKTTTTIATKNAKAPGEDSFGIICGDLQGKIEKVEVVGNQLQINQKAKEEKKEETENTKTTKETYIYQKSVNYRFSEVDDTRISLSAPAFYGKTVKGSGSNDAVGELFSIAAKAPANVITDKDGAYTIVYELTVKATGSDVSGIVLKAPDGITGTWNIIGGQESSGNEVTLTSVNNAGTEVKFTYRGTYSGESSPVSTSMKFQAYKVVENQKVTASSNEPHTTVYKQEDQSVSGGIPEIPAGMLKLTISGVKEIGSSAERVSYTVTVKNTSADKTVKNITLNYNNAGWDIQEPQDTGSFSLGANDEKTYTFIKKKPFSEGQIISLTLTASGQVKLEDGTYQTITTGSCTNSTKVVKSAGITEKEESASNAASESPNVAANLLQVKIKGRDELEKTAAASLTYTVTITNSSGSSLDKVELTGAGNDWSVKDEAGNVIAVKSPINVGTMANNTSKAYTFTRTGFSSEESVSLSVTASGDLLIGEQSQTITTTACLKTTTLVPPANGEKTNPESSNSGIGSLNLSIQSPKYAAESSTIDYTVQITSDRAGTFTLTGPAGGNWKDGSGNSQDVTFEEGDLPTVKSFTYQISKTDGVTFGLTEEGFSISKTSLKVSEIDTTTKTTPQAIKNSTIDAGALKLEVTAPAVLEEDNGSAVITYTIDCAGILAGTKLTASQSGGTWTGKNTTSTNGVYTTVSDEQTVTYTVTVPAQPTDDQTPFQIENQFTALYETEGNTVYAETGKIISAVYKKNASLSSTITEGSLTMVLSTPAYTTKEEAVFTLTLSNTDAAKRIYIGTFPAGWKKTIGKWDSTKKYQSIKNGEIWKSLEGNILPAGGSITFTENAVKADASVDGFQQTVSLSGIQTIEAIDAYLYQEKKEDPVPGNGASSETSSDDAGFVYTGNHLYAGAIAGRGSAGSTISEVSQKINLSANVEGQPADNGAVLMAGGIIGNADSLNFKDLYVQGDIQNGNYLIGTGTASPLQNIIVTGTEDIANLGTANASVTDTVLVGQQKKPLDTWGNNWKNYDYYSSASEPDKISGFDLAWLVKENAFTVTSPKGTETEIKTSIDGLTRDVSSWHMAYRARKAQDDKDQQLYYSDEQNLPIGDSGYYQIENLYATDGYYHYLQGKGAMVYPFSSGNQKPEFYDDSDWKVVRTDKDGLTDQIQLPLNEKIDCTMYYYDTDSNKWVETPYLNTDGRNVITYPFTADEVTIRLLPKSSGKFYEESTSKPFTVEDHLPLPAPRVTIVDFYKEKGTENVVDFADQAFYGQESKLDITDVNTKCSYQYCLSNKELLESEWTTTQLEHNATGYTVNSSAFENAEWKDVSDGFELSDKEGTWYLYVKVEAAGYPSTIYRYGSCTTCLKATADIHVYLDDGTELAENDRIASGDSFKFRFTMTQAEKLGMTRLQYLVSATELSGEKLHLDGNWTLYEDASITINRPSGADGYYIYARIYNAEEKKYQEVDTYHYLFVDEAGTVTISPRTVSVESTSDASAASIISSSSPVYLSCQEKGARILYLISDTLNNKFSFVRVTENLSGLTDGKNGYFKIGNRWYRTDASVQVYTDSISFYNGESGTKPQYIHTAVLGTEGEPGKTVTYAYQVSPMGQASVPEASMDTLHFPGGEDKDSTQVQKGASLSFQSLTPGAELYYVIGDSNAEVLDHEEGETKLYDSKNGIEVEGDYGNQFVIRMKAVKWSTDGTGRKELKDSETVRFIYTIADQDQAVAPTATPSTSDQEPTVITPGDKILLSTPTKGASIYYTADGSAPSVTKSEDGTFAPAGSTLLYDAGQGIIAPSSGNGYFTVRAIAVHPELSNSPEAKYTYSFPSDVEMPYANIPSGDVDMGTEVILKNKTEGAEIYYTVSRDGTTPEDPTISSSVFDATQPIIINGATVIKAIAVKDGVKSGILTLTYNSREQLSAPTASIDSGAMVSRGTRLKLKAADGASIYYTMDGSDPSDQSNASVISGSELILDGTAGSTVTVKACARKDGKSVSEVVTFTYQISQSAGGVTADVPNGTLVSIGSKINLMTDVTDAEIRYTTDGSSPVDSGIKGTVVTVEGTSGSSFMIKAVAVVDGDAGTVCTFTYKIKEKPSAPTASPSGGTLTVATRVELNSSAEKIYYTTDGVTPTESSNFYKEPILINKTTNLKAIAVSADGEVSEVASFQYTAALKAEKPTASHDTGTVLEPGTIVALHTDTSGAEIYYSTDGTEPTRDNLDSMTLYTEDGITVNRTVTILAAAYREDMQLSAVTELYYQVDTIPAVEQKKAEEALLEEQQLKDTDSSGLARTEEQQQSTSYQSRVLRERDCNTVVSSTWESIPSDAVLVTEKQEYGQEALANVRQLFGDDYTIISSYNMYLMRGSTIAQPQGEVEIGMPIPEAYENAAVTIVYIDKNNKITKKETRRQDGMAYAKTDHFSNYALVGLEEAASDGWTVSYLLILEAAAAVTVIAGLGYYISRKWKKMKRDR